MSTSANSSILAPRVGLRALLAAGPVATVVTIWALAASGSDLVAAAPMWMYLTVALVLWSPLPFSLPAVLLERERDAALPGYRGVGRAVRAALLVPHMLTRSPARVEFAASLLGFAGAAAVVAVGAA